MPYLRERPSIAGFLIWLYTVGGRKTVTLFHLNGMMPFHFCSACTRVQLIVGCCLPTCQKLKASSFTCRVKSIVLHCHSLLKSLRQYATAALQFWACSEIAARLGLKLAINDWSSLHCQSTPIASKCNHSARIMLLLACLDFSRRLVRASYDQDSRPHLPSLACRHAPFCSVSVFLYKQPGH